MDVTLGYYEWPMTFHGKHMINKFLYGKLHLISAKIQVRRMRFRVDNIKELLTIMSHRDYWKDCVFELEKED